MGDRVRLSIYQSIYYILASTVYRVSTMGTTVVLSLSKSIDFKLPLSVQDITSCVLSATLISLRLF
jgi:hypothetical protein